jgi:2-methylcitrate dehydratase PrpD
VEVKRRPRTIIDAQFSVPWVVATAVAKGKVTVDDFTDEAIKRQEILKIAQKVSGRLVPEMDRHGVGPGGIIINMKSGEEYREEVEYCLGSAERPMSLNDITKKFRECAAFSKKPLPDATVDKVIEMVGRLEKLDDATQIIKML